MLKKCIRSQYLSANSTVVFQFILTANRSVVDSHINDMKRAIDKYGNTRAVIVAEIPHLGPGLWILDGQHLYQACKSLGWEIEYKIVEPVKDAKALAERLESLNNNAKAWTINDYLFSKSYLFDYQQLIQLKKDSILELGILAEIMMNCEVKLRHPGGSPIIKLIKSGHFTVNYPSFAKRVLINILPLKGILGRDMKRAVVSVMIEKMQKYGEDYDNLSYVKHVKDNLTEILLHGKNIENIVAILRK